MNYITPDTYLYGALGTASKGLSSITNAATYYTISDSTTIFNTTVQYVYKGYTTESGFTDGITSKHFDFSGTVTETLVASSVTLTVYKDTDSHYFLNSTFTIPFAPINDSDLTLVEGQTNQYTCTYNIVSISMSAVSDLYSMALINGSALTSTSTTINTDKIYAVTEVVKGSEIFTAATTSGVTTGFTISAFSANKSTTTGNITSIDTGVADSFALIRVSSLNTDRSSESKSLIIKQSITNTDGEAATIIIPYIDSSTNLEMPIVVMGSLSASQTISENNSFSLTATTVTISG